MCGAKPGWARQLPELFDDKGPLLSPALVVAAENDPVVGDGPYDMARLFRDPLIRTHNDGHKPLPSGGKDKRAALDALTDDIANFLRKHCLEAEEEEEES
mmetsp:Transcript_11955/g.39330  ORF Transcript_11955/g.39330 Transcript_11955/m.39330 type:complete len:100 (+) Transcript_11955:422-721(+)